MNLDLSNAFMKSSKKYSFFRRNGLSLTVLILMLVFWAGQALTGWREHNKDLEEKNASSLSYVAYLGSGHFFAVDI